MVSFERIIWSPSAREDLENIAGYLMFNWGLKIFEKFIAHLNRLIQQIAINPKQYPLINQKMNIRKCVITKQNTLFYREKNNRIEIIRIFDTRQDQGKLKILYG